VSLQYLWNLFSNHPAQVVNGLALFLALAGAWLLLATRIREQRAVARLAAASDLADDAGSWLDEPTLRINPFLLPLRRGQPGRGLALSFYSTGL